MHEAYTNVRTTFNSLFSLFDRGRSRGTIAGHGGPRPAHRARRVVPAPRGAAARTCTSPASDVFEGAAARPTTSSSTPLERRLHLVPRYRQRLALVPLGQGRPRWVDDPHFNVRYHVRHTALPAPGRRGAARAAGRAHLLPAARPRQAAVGDLARRGPGGRPLRDLGKTHHALVDGVSGVDITTVLFDTSRDPAPPRPPAEPWSRGRCPVRRPAARRGAARARDDPRRDRRAACARASAGAAPVASRRATALIGVGALAWAGLNPAPATPSTSHRPAPPLQVGRRRPRAVQGDQERARRHGQRRRPQRRDARARALPAPPRRRHRRPVLKAMVPVSVRADVERGALGNRVAAMWAPLPVGIERPARRASPRSTRRWSELKAVRPGGRRPGADRARRLRAADAHEPGRAAAVAPALLQPRRHQRAGAAVPALPARAARCEALYPVVPLAERPGAGHRDHDLRRPARLRAAGRLRRAARPRRPRRGPAGAIDELASRGRRQARRRAAPAARARPTTKACAESRCASPWPSWSRSPPWSGCCCSCSRATARRSAATTAARRQAAARPGRRAPRARPRTSSTPPPRPPAARTAPCPSATRRSTATRSCTRWRAGTSSSSTTTPPTSRGCARSPRTSPAVRSHARAPARPCSSSTAGTRGRHRAGLAADAHRRLRQRPEAPRVRRGMARPGRDTGRRRR